MNSFDAKGDPLLGSVLKSDVEICHVDKAEFGNLGFFTLWLDGGKKAHSSQTKSTGKEVASGHRGSPGCGGAVFSKFWVGTSDAGG
jgi:hypothetical protein